jgi:hypothetical protein
MTKYFEGIHTSEPYSFILDGRQIKYLLHRRWINTGWGQTVRCNIPAVMKIEYEVGFEKKVMAGFKTFIEGSIGVDKLASVKSHVETNLSISISETEKRAIKRDFTLPAPECGSQTVSLYRETWEHEFIVTKPRFFMRPSVKAYVLPEDTQNFDLQVLHDKDDPACPCGDSINKPNEIFSLKIGSLSLRIDGKKNDADQSIKFDVGKKTFEFAFSSFPFTANITMDELPEIFAFLSGVDGDQVVAEISIEQSDPMYAVADNLVIDVISTAQESG